MYGSDRRARSSGRGGNNDADYRSRWLVDYLSTGDTASPALLKLDVQGYELEALHGCEALLSRFTWVYCECSFLPLYEGQALADEVIAWLRERGMVLNGVYNLAYDRDGQAVQADFLFQQGVDLHES